MMAGGSSFFSCHPEGSDAICNANGFTQSKDPFPRLTLYNRGPLRRNEPQKSEPS